MYAAAGGASLASRRHRKQMVQVPPNRLHHPPNPMQLHQQANLGLPHSAHSAHSNGRLHAAYGSQEGGAGGSKAAWQERRGSTGTAAAAGASLEGSEAIRCKASEAHRRWMKRNRVHDASYGGSSSDEDDWPGGGGIYGHQSAAANALLYVGLGTVAIGLVIAFVGTGEKGFKTLELRLIGPTLIGAGLLCCFIRVLLCVCPSRCLVTRQRPQRSGKAPPSPHTRPRSREEIALVDRKPPPPPEPPPPPPPHVSLAAQSPITATSLFLRTEAADSLAAASSSVPTTIAVPVPLPSAPALPPPREPPALVHHPPTAARPPTASKMDRPRIPANGSQRRELVLTPSKLAD